MKLIKLIFAMSVGVFVSWIRFSTLEAICRELDCQPGDIIEYRPDLPAEEE